MLDRADVLARTRHDLGKYVAMLTRNTDPSDLAALRDALRSDLGATRSPDFACDAVWASLRPDWIAAHLDPAPIDGRILALRMGLDHLHTLSPAELQALGQLAVELGTHLRDLHRAAS